MILPIHTVVRARMTEAVVHLYGLDSSDPVLADMPVEQPTRVYLTVNLRTAKSIDVAIPRSLLLRADAVIE